MVNAVQICGYCVQWMVNEYNKILKLINHLLNTINHDFEGY